MKLTHMLPAAALFMASATMAFAEKPDAPTKIDGATSVNAEQILELIDEKDDLVVIDSRKEKDYLAGHIDGSVNLRDDLTNEESLAKVVATKATPALFYCNGIKCGRAAKAVKIAVDLGYTSVYYYPLGMAEWMGNNLPVATGE